MVIFGFGNILFQVFVDLFDKHGMNVFRNSHAQLNFELAKMCYYLKNTSKERVHIFINREPYKNIKERSV